MRQAPSGCNQRLVRTQHRCVECVFIWVGLALRSRCVSLKCVRVSVCSHLWLRMNSWTVAAPLYHLLLIVRTDTHTHTLSEATALCWTCDELLKGKQESGGQTIWGHTARIPNSFLMLLSLFPLSASRAAPYITMSDSAAIFGLRPLPPSLLIILHISTFRSSTTPAFKPNTLWFQFPSVRSS